MSQHVLYQIQYGKSSTRQKKIYTSDGTLLITKKHVNAFLVSLRDDNDKELYKKQLPEVSSYNAGSEVTMGGYDVYIDIAKENINIPSSTSNEAVNQATIAKQPSKEVRSSLSTPLPSSTSATNQRPALKTATNHLKTSI